MKSSMPFHGVDVTALRAICKRAFAAHPLEDAAAWRKDVLAIWRGARFREERYAAIELTGDRRARPFQTMAALPMYEEMIVTGAWWDLVDALASKRLGEILRNEPRPMRKAMRALEPRRRHVEEEERDPLPDHVQGGHGPRPSLRPDRAVALLEGVLPEEGDRLGAAVATPGRTRGPSSRYVEKNRARLVAALDPRGAEERRASPSGTLRTCAKSFAPSPALRALS